MISSPEMIGECTFAIAITNIQLNILSSTTEQISNDHTPVLIDVDGLTTQFVTDGGTAKVVKDVSFQIARGETLGIVGESGSGKSVTCYSITQLLPPKIATIIAGQIRMDGIDLLTLTEREMRAYRGRRIGMIFQEPMTALNPVHRCGAQVAEMLQLHTDLSRAQIKDRVLGLLGRVKLPDPELVYKAYPHQLSGGQLQRVMIAMAIACGPDLLIADEPTTALDVTVQREIILLLKELQRETGMAMLFISHDLGVISEVADRVVVMYRGAIVEQGAVDTIIHHPREAYTQGLVACRPPTAYRLSKLPTVADFIDDPSLTVEAYRESHVVTPDSYQSRLATVARQPVLVKVDGLTKRYGARGGLFSRGPSTVAVDNVAFEIHSGETMGLVGESGCGKSSLGKTMLRLTDAAAGTVAYNGTDLLQLSTRAMRAARKDVQYIFQDPFSSLNPRMTIGQAIIEPMQVHRLHDNKTDRRDKVMYLLQQVGLLPEHYDRYPHEFSGGQRQRISIARTLAVEPRFIICDESVSALDVSVQAQVLNLLDDLKREYGLTYLFISHDLSVVKHVSDRIMVMQGGKIVEMGDAEQVFNHPREAYTQRLIDSIPGRQ